MPKEQPNQSLYIQNLNDKIQKQELRAQLYVYFQSYGRILDVVALKTPKMRGQAFVVFDDLASATAALRAEDGGRFYGKPMKIDYARQPSHALLALQTPDASYAAQQKAAKSRLTVSHAQQRETGLKRAREEEAAAAEKRARGEEDEEEEGEDMEVEQGEADGVQGVVADGEAEREARDAEEASGAGWETGHAPSNALLVGELPGEVTDAMLAMLFQQYPGFHAPATQMHPAPTGSGSGLKSATVRFETVEQARTAMDALDRFALAPGMNMRVGWGR